MVERAVLKRNAKDELRGKWGIAVGAFLITIVLTSIISFIGSLADSPTIAIIGMIISILISGPVTYGLYTFVLNMVRGKKVSISDVFTGFKGKVIFKAFIIFILTGIAVTIGTIIFIVPGIILGLMFSQSYYILIDNNDLSAIDCIKESSRLMKGNKMYLFVLGLSFIGWFILGEITLGIGMLWISPYYSVTLGNFYENLK